MCVCVRVCLPFHLSFCLIVRCAYYTGAYSHVNLLLGFISICLSDFELCLCVSVGLCMSLFVAPYPLSNGGWGWGDLLQSWRNGVSFTVLLSSPFVFIFIHQSLLLCPLLLSFSSVLLPFFFFLLFCVFICPFTFQFFTFSFLVCPLLIFPLISHYPRRVISTLICPLVFIIYSLFLSSLLLSLCLLFNPWFSSSWGCPLLFFALFIHVEFSFFQCSLLIHFPLILLLRPLLPSSYFYFLPSSPLFHLALIFLFTHALYISPLFFFFYLCYHFSFLSSPLLSSPLLSCPLAELLSL